MHISIVGTGYVGLVTGACLADRGHDVTCVDLDPGKVEAINAAQSPIYEEGLSDLLGRHVGKRLRATTDLSHAVTNTEVTFIAVGTPTVDGRISLGQVEACARDIGKTLARKDGYHTVVVKSTVIPGTTDTVVRQAIESASGKTAGAGFGLGMNPEFLTEGQAVKDFSTPDRIVLGGIDARTHAVLKEVYADYSGVPVILTNPSTAEMIKYASNALLATMISFSNEIARVCAALPDTDVVDVMRGVHLSAYLTERSSDGQSRTAAISSFLEAGCGFGGSCLPKDVTALVSQGSSLGIPMRLLDSVLSVNKGQPEQLIGLIMQHHTDLTSVDVAILGLAFKPHTDDVRESPAFPLIRKLTELGANIVAYDPVARPVGHPDMKGVRLASDLNEAIQYASVVVLVTRWDEFQLLPELLAHRARQPLVVDGRRVLDPGAFANYEGIGRHRANIRTEKSSIPG